MANTLERTASSAAVGKKRLVLLEAKNSFLVDNKNLLGTLATFPSKKQKMTSPLSCKSYSVSHFQKFE
jgi:hypothetical protein